MRLITKSLLLTSLIVCITVMHAQKSVLQLYMNSNLCNKKLELKFNDMISSYTHQAIKTGSYSYSGGDGTETSPYLISNSVDLVNLSKAVDEGNTYEGKFFKMTSDIDMTKQYMIPIGSNFRVDGGPTGLRPFKGTFDGDNHIIMNFFVDYIGKYQIGTGIFGLIQNATIKNIRLENCSLQADALSGGLCGLAIGSKIINCHIGKTVKVTSKLHSYCSGILVGCLMQKCDIIDCSNRALIQNESVGSAGIIANNSADGTEVKRCVNFGKVYARGDNSAGIISYMEKGNVVVSDCANYGEIVSEGEVAGGICSLTVDCKQLQVSNCINIGAVNSSTGRAQPIVGALLVSTTKVVASNNYYNTDNTVNESVLYAEGLSLNEMMTDSFAERLNADRENGPWRFENDGYLYPFDNSKIVESADKIIEENSPILVVNKGIITINEDYHIDNIYDLDGHIYNHNAILPPNIYILRITNKNTHKRSLVKIII